MGVVPTVFGNTLALHAKAIEAQIRNAEAQIGSLKGKAQGHVTLGIGPSLATNLMPLATATLQRLHPGIALTVIEGLVDDLIPRLRRGELDIAVGAWPRVADPAFTTEPVVKDVIEVVARHGHPLHGRRVELRELAAYPWALPPATQKWRQVLDEMFLKEGLSPVKPSVVSNSAAYLLSLLRRGDHLSFLPRALIGLDEGFAALDVDMACPEPEICMTFRERALLNAPVAEVVQALRSIGAELSARPGLADLHETDVAA
jgi:DNA-binding transcriptional LysR family regulator